MNKNEIFSQITDKIIAKLKEGVLPWRKSWKTGIPMNYISKRPYNGINFLSLLMNDYSSPYYLTFLQCKGRQGRILPGQKGSLVIFWSLKEVTKSDEDVKLVPLLRYSYVYNLTQTDLHKQDETNIRSIECEEFFSSLKEKPVIKNNIARSYYSPIEDYISLPCIKDFSSPDEYYSTLFHELIHWTGHKSRLNRQLDKACEELVAELGSAYLSALCGIENTVIDNQASYIQSWLKVISLPNGRLLDYTKFVNDAIIYLSNI